MYMVEKSGKLLCRIVLIMLLFVLCFCASCGHKEARYALDMAEKRMWDEPDSALKVLESIVMPEDLEGKELADYALLLTQAQYRSNIVATSDSLINIAVGYYQDKDVEKRTASLLYKSASDTISYILLSFLNFSMLRSTSLSSSEMISNRLSMNCPVLSAIPRLSSIASFS